jgi:hypothetical protein
MVVITYLNVSIKFDKLNDLATADGVSLFHFHWL